MKKQSFFIILIISIALSAGIWREHQNKGKVTQKAVAMPSILLTAGTALPTPQRLPKFELEDMDGNTFSSESLKQHWSFVFFGYSACPNICPDALQSLHLLSQRLKGLPAVQFLFITIDPEHDDKNRLKQYLRQPQFGGNTFIGLTGQKEEILTLAKKMGVYISKEAETIDNLEHSGTLFLINPDGKLSAVFSNGTKPHAIAHDTKEIIHHYAMNG